MPEALAPSVTTRDPKGRKFISVIEAAYNKMALSEEEAQRINDTPGLAELVGNFIAENRQSNRFRDEERASSYGYPKGYSVKDMTVQTNRLRELFPGVGYADEKVTALPLPPNAEGWFAIPRWETLASTYGEAVEKVLAMIKKTRDGKFYNYREGQLGPNYLRQSELSARMLQAMAKQQKGYDILIIPAQFGLCHRGRSVRRARELFGANEFGLGAFACGVMFLTHPERFSTGDELWIDCAGDDYAPGAVGQFEFAPCFYFIGDGVGFDAYWPGDASGYYGSVSGFLPQ